VVAVAVRQTVLTNAGENGGSGGGTAYDNTSPGTGTANQGFAGGSGSGSTAGQGGGGAGAAVVIRRFAGRR
jgi:hypothetical protein